MTLRIRPCRQLHTRHVQAERTTGPKTGEAQTPSQEYRPQGRRGHRPPSRGI